MATRRQQTRAFKAVKQAQGLGVFPYDWRPPDTEQMKMEDPLQVRGTKSRELPPVTRQRKNRELKPT